MRNVVIFLLLFIATVSAEEHSQAVTEFSLPNGIRILLKPTDLDDDEVLLHGVAPGGYASVPTSQRASAEIAPQIAWESGVGELNASQLSKYLFDLCLELTPYIHPYSHGINGVAHTDQLTHLLVLIRRLYTEPQFKPAVADQVIQYAGQSFELRKKDPDYCFDEATKNSILSSSPSLLSLTRDDLQKVSFGAAKAFYEQEFLNTSGMTFILVGDFNPHNIRPIIEEQLGQLPNSRPHQHNCYAPPTFPTGVSTTTVKGLFGDENPVRITFPLRIELDEQNLNILELTTQVIETRLRQALIKHKGSSKAIDVGYEMPAYPHLDAVWLTFQFRSPPGQRQEILNFILTEIKNLTSSGPTEEELMMATDLVQQNDEFWEQENNYWIALLSNCCQWGWNFDRLSRSQRIYTISREQVKAILQKALDLSQYNLAMGENP